MSVKLDVNIIKLCRAGRCCPTMDIRQDKVILTDDYAGSVQLTLDEMEILMEKYNEAKARTAGSS